MLRLNIQCSSVARIICPSLNCVYPCFLLFCENDTFSCAASWGSFRLSNLINFLSSSSESICECFMSSVDITTPHSDVRGEYEK